MIKGRSYFAAGRMVFHACVRAIAFMLIIRYCWEFHCAICGNIEKVEISTTRCGLRQSMNRP